MNESSYGLTKNYLLPTPRKCAIQKDASLAEVCHKVFIAGHVASIPIMFSQEGTRWLV